jgi:hypothetical protein
MMVANTENLFHYLVFPHYSNLLPLPPVFLLSLGGVSLLCVLSALAILSILVSLVLGACYITSYNVINFYYSQRYQNTQHGVNTHTHRGPSFEILIFSLFLSLFHPVSVGTESLGWSLRQI